MLKNQSKAFVILFCVGGVASFTSAASESETPTKLKAAHSDTKMAAHIYYNIVSGERIITLFSDNGSIGEVGGPIRMDQAGAGGSTSGPIWSAISFEPCPAATDSGAGFYIADDNSTGGTSLATGVETVDFGDIALDSVVDMVSINWITAHNDVDTNSDGLGDGVIGLGGQWTYWDADNGRAINSSTRLPLVSILFADLPGNIFGDGFLTGYTADIDLAGTASSALTFELGDSDGVSSAMFLNNDVDTNSDGIGDGVSVANADRDFDGLPDSDLDGDGLFDWGWSVRFFQPGTEDLDGDGVIDGDFADGQQPIGLPFALPAGMWTDQGDDTWTWEQPAMLPSDYAHGADDRIAIYQDGNYAGGFFFGGPSCSPLGYIPLGQFEQQLFGPDGGSECCAADFNCDGSLDFFDISQFLSSFSAQDSQADFNNDGVFNFFDVSAFLSAFSAGCP
ncbi:MAG: GC-type dockerin domain-anchored protein [Phycisphaerales bacterium]|nr:GC-type dockerin domain-anchored protein [Phycisphaerales bacterium]